MKRKIIEENLKVHQQESKIYDAFHIEIYNWYENKQINRDIEYIKNLFKNKKEVKLLDLGCGTGNISLRFVDDDKFKITGVDLSKEMLREFRKKIHSSRTINLINLDLENFLNKNSGKYDLVTICSTLHHLYEPYQIFKEVLRFLNKGGAIYLTHEPLLKEQQKIKFFSTIINFFDRVISNFYWLYKLKEIPQIDHTIADYYSKEGIDTKKLKEFLKENFNILYYKEYSVNRMALTNLIDNKLVKTKGSFKLIAQKK